MSDALVAFLNARLDEDERAEADKAFDAWWPSHAVRHNSRSPLAAREAFRAGWEARSARVLREVAFLRHIIEEHHPAFPTMYPEPSGKPWCPGCNIGSYDVEYADWPCATLRALAAVYRDHDDYQQDWA